MIEFVFPWAFLALPLPLFVWLIAPAHKEREDAIRVPFFEILVKLSGEKAGRGSTPNRNNLQRILITSSWCLLIIAIARPEHIGDPIDFSRSSRDIMIAVDISGSMETRDFFLEDQTAISRLDAVKKVLEDFARHRSEDRLGLIVFGDAPYLQAPFTSDHQAWIDLLYDSQIGMAGRRTSIGDAIGLAIRSFKNSKGKNKTMILLTDGNDTSSQVRPVDAARIAAQEEIRIYTVAIGDPASVAEEAIDEKTLSEIAERTAAKFYSAKKNTQLEIIHNEIQELEKEEIETAVFYPRKNLFHIPLGLSLLLTLCLHGLFIFTTERAKREAMTQ